MITAKEAIAQTKNSCKNVQEEVYSRLLALCEQMIEKAISEQKFSCEVFCEMQENVKHFLKEKGFKVWQEFRKYPYSKECFIISWEEKSEEE